LANPSPGRCAIHRSLRKGTGFLAGGSKADNLPACCRMNSDTQNLIEEVRKRTGYPVNVEVSDLVSDHARMVSARPESPTHLIEVNSHYRAQAPYIVAAQCCMLLVTWSDPSKVGWIAMRREESRDVVNKWLQAPPLRLLEADKGVELGNLYLRGLLNQVFSTPLELTVISHLYKEAPSLREAQDRLQDIYLRKLTSILAPNFRASLPEDVFKASVAMNGAMALNWSRLTGQKALLVPYESLGALERASHLLDLVQDLADQRSSPSHIKAVDQWAETLSLRLLYGWESSDRRS
jgi:hypothetical protein